MGLTNKLLILLSVLIVVLPMAFAWIPGYSYRFPLDCTNATGVPVAINGSNGVTLPGDEAKQFIWTVCQPSTYLYYIDAFNYTTGNDTDHVPFEIEVGNGTNDIDYWNVWTGYFAVYHGFLQGYQILDSSPYSNHATSVNVNNATLSSEPSFIGNSLSFDGSTCYVSGASGIGTTTPFTIMNFVRFNTTAGYQQSIAVGLFGITDWRAPLIHAGGGTFDFIPWQLIDAFTTLTKDTDNHIFFSYWDNTASGVWANVSGGVDNIVTYVGSPSANSNFTFALGCEASSNAWKMTGYLDEVRAYNGNMTPIMMSQIISNHNNIAGYGMLGNNEGNFPLVINNPTVNETFTTSGLPYSVYLNYTTFNVTDCWFNLDSGTNFSLPDCNNTYFNVSSYGNHYVTVYANYTGTVVNKVQPFSVVFSPNWINGYSYRIPFDCDSANGTVVLINNSYGLSLPGNNQKQYIMTRCDNSTGMFLYYNTYANYTVADGNQVLRDFEVVYGNGTSSNPDNLWSGYLDVHHLTKDYLDSSPLHNNMELQGGNAYFIPNGSYYAGRCVNFDAGAWLENLTTSNIPFGNNDMTFIGLAYHPHSGYQSGMMMSVGGTDGSNYFPSFAGYTAGGDATYSLQLNGYYTGTGYYTINEPWANPIFIAMTYIAATGEVHIYDEPQAGGALNDWASSSGAFDIQAQQIRIGRALSNAYPYIWGNAPNNCLQEVRLYNGTLPLDQINPIHLGIRGGAEGYGEAEETEEPLSINIISPSQNQVFYSGNIPYHLYLTYNVSLGAICWYVLDSGNNVSLPNCNNDYVNIPSFGLHNITVYARNSEMISISDTKDFNVTFSPAPTVIINTPVNGSSLTVSGLPADVVINYNAIPSINNTLSQCWADSIPRTYFPGCINGTVPYNSYGPQTITVESNDTYNHIGSDTKHFALGLLTSNIASTPIVVRNITYAITFNFGGQNASCTIISNDSNINCVMVDGPTPANVLCGVTYGQYGSVKLYGTCIDDIYNLTYTQLPITVTLDSRTPIVAFQIPANQTGFVTTTLPYGVVLNYTVSPRVSNCYVPTTTQCYQPFANESTYCGAVGGGSYSNFGSWYSYAPPELGYDNDWSTRAIPLHSDAYPPPYMINYFLITYFKSAGAVYGHFRFWVTCQSSGCGFYQGPADVNLPLSCWNYYPDKVVIRFGRTQGGPWPYTGYLLPQCYDGGTGYEGFTDVGLPPPGGPVWDYGAFIADTGMLWDMTRIPFQNCTNGTFYESSYGLKQITMIAESDGGLKGNDTVWINVGNLTSNISQSPVVFTRNIQYKIIYNFGGYNATCNIFADTLDVSCVGSNGTSPILSNCTFLAKNENVSLYSSCTDTNGFVYYEPLQPIVVDNVLPVVAIQQPIPNSSITAPLPYTTLVNYTASDTYPITCKLMDYCYQNLANESTACGGYNNGTYYIYNETPISSSDYSWADGNWNTGFSNSAPFGLYTNYSIPYVQYQTMRGAVYQIKGTLLTQLVVNTLNLTIPNDCLLNNYTLSLDAEIYGPNLAFYCRNASQPFTLYSDNTAPWILLLSFVDLGNNEFYEGAINWDFGKDLPTCANTSATVNSFGVHDVTIKATNIYNVSSTYTSSFALGQITSNINSYPVITNVNQTYTVNYLGFLGIGVTCNVITNTTSMICSPGTSISPAPISVGCAVNSNTYENITLYARCNDSYGYNYTESAQSALIYTKLPAINIQSPIPNTGTVVSSVPAVIPLKYTVSTLFLDKCWVYAPQSGRCYQETANASSLSDGVCGLVYSGSYSNDGTWNNNLNTIDGIWNTYGYASAGAATEYINYTPPVSALSSSLWQTSGIGLSGGGVVNLSIVSCWNPSLLQFKMISSFTNNSNYWYCYNTTNSWQLLRTAGLGPNGYGINEEGMWWNLSSIITRQTLANCTNSSFVFGTYGLQNMVLYVNNSYGGINNVNDTFGIGSISSNVPNGTIITNGSSVNYTITYNIINSDTCTLVSDNPLFTCEKKQAMSPINISCNYVLTAGRVNIYASCNDSNGFYYNESTKVIGTVIIPNVTILNPYDRSGIGANALPVNIPLNYVVKGYSIDRCWYVTKAGIKAYLPSCINTTIPFYSYGSDFITVYSNNTVAQAGYATASFNIGYISSTVSSTPVYTLQPNITKPYTLSYNFGSVSPLICGIVSNRTNFICGSASGPSPLTINCYTTNLSTEIVALYGSCFGNDSNFYEETPFNVLVDNIPPVVTALSPPNSSYTGALPLKFAINYSAIHGAPGAVSQCWYTVSNGDTGLLPSCNDGNITFNGPFNNWTYIVYANNTGNVIGYSTAVSFAAGNIDTNLSSYYVLSGDFNVGVTPHVGPFATVCSLITTAPEVVCSPFSGFSEISGTIPCTITTNVQKALTAYVQCTNAVGYSFNSPTVNLYIASGYPMFNGTQFNSANKVASGIRNITGQFNVSDSFNVYEVAAFLNGVQIDSRTGLNVPFYTYNLNYNLDGLYSPGIYTLMVQVWNGNGHVHQSNVSYSFYIGKALNVNAYNLATGLPNNNFTVDVVPISVDIYTGQFSGPISFSGSTGLIENLTAGTYNFNWSSPTMISNQQHVIINNGSQNIQYTSSSAQLIVYVRNLQDQTPISGGIAILQNASGFYNQINSTTAILTYYLNPSLYSLNLTMGGFYTPHFDNNISLSYQENLTYYADIGYTLSFTFYDEKTLAPFNMSSPTSLILEIRCTQSTLRIPIINSTTYLSPSNNTFSTPVNCTFVSYTFHVFFGDLSPAVDYFRTFIYNPLNTFSAVNSVYLMDLRNTVYVIDNLIIDDLLGIYATPSIFVKEWVNTQLVTITSDFTDVENKIVAYLMQNNQYVLELYSSNQPMKVLGNYVASDSGNKILRLYAVMLGPIPPSTITQTGGSITDSNNTKYAYFYYNNTAGSTSFVTVEIIANRTSSSPGILLANYTTTESSLFYGYDLTGYNTSDITVIGTVGGPQGTYRNVYQAQVQALATPVTTVMQYFNWSYITGANGKQKAVLGNTLQWFITLLIAFIALAATIDTGNIISFVLIIFGAFFQMIGIWPVSMAILGLSFLVALISLLVQGRRGQ